jgi:hypothetical protein
MRAAHFSLPVYGAVDRFIESLFMPTKLVQNQMGAVAKRRSLVKAK